MSNTLVESEDGFMERFQTDTAVVLHWAGVR
jgi:hypothetical protein